MEVPQEMIEGGAKIVADISDDEAEVIRNGPEYLNAYGTVSSIILSYFTSDKAMGLAIVEPLKTSLESVKMEIRSPQLLEGTMHNAAVGVPVAE